MDPRVKPAGDNLGCDALNCARLVVARATTETLDSLDLQFPKIQGAALKELEQVRAALEADGREHANAKKPSTSKDR
jgi:hypothetical protein